MWTSVPRGKAYNGILQIFSGQAGGTTGLFTMLVSEIIGAERQKVDIVREGKKRGLVYRAQDRRARSR